MLSGPRLLPLCEGTPEETEESVRPPEDELPPERELVEDRMEDDVPEGSPRDATTSV